MPARKKKEILSFEENLSRLESIVKAMESGDMPLDELIESYSKGMEYSKACAEALDKAEKSIDILIKESGKRITETELNIE